MRRGSSGTRAAVTSTVSLQDGGEEVAEAYVNEFHVIFTHTHTEWR